MSITVTSDCAEEVLGESTVLKKRLIAARIGK
jgi:hypothetical protein